MPDPYHDLWNTRFLGVQAVQYWVDFLVWEKFLDAHPELKACVEIGSLRGGLSLYLYLQCLARDMHFDTFDLNRVEAAATRIGGILGLGGVCLQGDVFDPATGGRMLAHILGDGTRHPLVLLCDGGNKPQEFQTFVPLLQAGDLVAVHDWQTEFAEADTEPVKELVERIFSAECEAHESFTVFYRRL